MILFDTNMILRYLLNDSKEMAETAEQYIDTGDAAVTIEVIAEATYVLKGVYAMEHDLIAETLKSFLQLVDCEDKDVLNAALDTYGAKPLDFVDCVLYGYHAVRGTEIATFDQKLLKLLNGDT